MRDPKRIPKFLNKLGKYWQESCPDWRFGQLIINVFDSMDVDPWLLEEGPMLKEFENYLNIEKDAHKLRPKRKRRGLNARKKQE